MFHGRCGNAGNLSPIIRTGNKQLADPTSNVFSSASNSIPTLMSVRCSSSFFGTVPNAPIKIGTTFTLFIIIIIIKFIVNISWTSGLDSWQSSLLWEVKIVMSLLKCLSPLNRYFQNQLYVHWIVKWWNISCFERRVIEL